MSGQLASLRDILDLLRPLHEAQQRGLSSKTIERIYECLLDVEDELEEAEDKLVQAEGELEEAEDALAEAERRRTSRKPPL